MRHRHRAVNIDSSKLVYEIKKYPALYDRGDPEYRNMEHKNSAWRAISAVIQLPVQDCQSRWKSLRDRFVREKKSIKQDPSNKVSWPLYYQLTFLTNCISHKTRRKDEDNSDAVVSEDEDDEETGGSRRDDDDTSMDNEETVYGNVEDECVNGNVGVRVGDISIEPVQSHQTKKSSVVGRKRPFDESAKISELLTELVNKPVPDEDDLFFMSAAKMIKRVPEEKKSTLKVKIMQLISEAEELT